MRSKWLIFAAVLIVALAGCGKDKDKETDVSSAASDAASDVSQAEPTSGVPASNPTATWEKGVLPQFSDPEPGTPVITLHTNKGDIKVMLFPQAAPLTVENFLTHCQDGYYDGISFHRVINDFMIQGGDPTATGTSGESIWGEDFQDEFSDNLHNFRGALSMANAGISTNSSQFFIVQAGPNTPNNIDASLAEPAMLSWLQNKLVWQGTLDMMAKAKTAKDQAELDAFVDGINASINERLTAGLTEDDRATWQSAIDKYIEVGGTPSLDYKHTVFGQVLEGMDVVDAIAAVEATNDKPNEDVIIESTTVETAE